jgi:biopolymer transport protein ExbB
MRVSQAVALLLLAMSVASWVVILWKAWLLHRAGADVARVHGGVLAGPQTVEEHATRCGF